jgi:hypothetical protein
VIPPVAGVEMLGSWPVLDTDKRHKVHIQNLGEPTKAKAPKRCK